MKMYWYLLATGFVFIGLGIKNQKDTHLVSANIMFVGAILLNQIH